MSSTNSGIDQGQVWVWVQLKLKLVSTHTISKSVFSKSCLYYHDGQYNYLGLSRMTSGSHKDWISFSVLLRGTYLISFKLCPWQNNTTNKEFILKIWFLFGQPPKRYFLQHFNFVTHEFSSILVHPVHSASTFTLSALNNINKEGRLNKSKYYLQLCQFLPHFINFSNFTTFHHSSCGTSHVCINKHDLKGWGMSEKK